MLSFEMVGSLAVAGTAYCTSFSSLLHPYMMQIDNSRLTLLKDLFASDPTFSKVKAKAQQNWAEHGDST